MRNLVSIFRALADETRLQMLALALNHEELCVCDFVNVLDITQSKASRHLRYLLNAGFLSDRRETVWSYYRIADSLDSEHEAILKTLREIIGDEQFSELEQKLSVWLKHKTCGSERIRSNSDEAVA